MSKPVANPGPSIDPQRLVAATAALIGATPASTARFGLAVSGGPDSLALLLLANSAFPGRIAVATVDHQLRPESAAEAALVGQCCAQLDVPHFVLLPPVAITGSIQSAARQMRYSLLAEWRVQQSLDWLMTAHHADDQLETVVMRLNRGSGVAGLAAIRGRQGHVLRPLLMERRDGLQALVARHGWQAVDDPSNHDQQFDRVRVRRALAGNDWLDPVAVATSAAALNDAEQAILWTVEHVLAERIVADGDGIAVDTAGLPRELVRRLIIMALAQLEPDRPAPRGAALTHALDTVAHGQQAMLGDTVLRHAPGRPGTILLSKSKGQRHS